MEISGSQLRSAGSESLTVKLKNSYFVQRLVANSSNRPGLGDSGLWGRGVPSYGRL